jgi:hypothetical protein
MKSATATMTPPKMKSKVIDLIFKCIFHFTIVSANIKEVYATEVVWDGNEASAKSFPGIRSHVLCDMRGHPTIYCSGNRERSISFGDVPEIQFYGKERR